MERSIDSVNKKEQLKYTLSTMLGLKAPTRESILELLREFPFAISMHEHIGDETLNFSNGFKSRYVQTIDELFASLKGLPWGKNYNFLASMVTPMPVYYYSINAEKKSDLNPGYGVYGQHNEDLLSKSNCIIKENVNVIPLPFVAVDIRVPRTEFERAYNNSIFPIMGLKIHPGARNISIKDIIKSGYLDFAKEKSLPITIHCARTGVEGDFEDIAENLLPFAEEKGVNICIAHAGFLHHNISEIKNYSNVYTDISPWNIIINSFNRDLVNNFNEQVNLLYNFLSTFEDRVLYGGDSPYDIQHWQTGEVIGKGRYYDFNVLNEAISKSTEQIPKKLFNLNPIKFLSNLKSNNSDLL